MITLKKITAPNGMPGQRVYAGANCLGTIFNPDARDWRAVTPNGKRFQATSKPKIIEMLRSSTRVAI